jgi:hypothetical protein
MPQTLKYRLHQDETLSLDLFAIADNLNRIFGGTMSFDARNERINIPGTFIKNPESYDALAESRHLRTEANAADIALIITKKPYDNNFFWDTAPGKLVIFSCFAWEELTTLPMSNGLIYGISCLVSGSIGLSRSNPHNEVTGCINDFLWDKKGIDVCMRSAFVCPECMKHFGKKKLHANAQTIYDSLIRLLNDLSSASRANSDILTFWGFRSSETRFDAFLCHNSQEKEQVRKIGNQLKKCAIRPWLDEEQIQPGRAWQDVLETTIPNIKTAVVFVGVSGLGPWQNVEIPELLT